MPPSVPGAVSASSRLTQLDAMRGIAALMGVVFHFTSRYAEVYPQSAESGSRFALGSYGVDFFFVLSGFVIFLSLDSCRDVWQFAKLRFWRLFPVYWAAVLITAAVIFLAGAPGQEEGLSLPVVIANLAMVHQFLYVPNVDGVYWTLAYEFAFYCWAALLHFSVPRRAVEPLVLAYAVVALTVTFSSRHFAWEIPYPLILGLMLDYVQLFAAGVVLYFARCEGLTPARVAMLVFYAGVQGYQHGVTGFVMTAIVLLAIVAVIRGRLVWLNSPAMLFLGAISYSLYLIHQSIGHALMYHLINVGVSPLLASLAALLVSVLLASLLTFAVERPVLRVVRRKPGLSAKHGALASTQSPS